jgi:4-hydroxy-L-threonine phosphate dehydrogenase PdxA
VFANPPNAHITIGRVSPEAGRAAYDTIVRAVQAAWKGDVDAIATAPVNKAAFAKAGLPWKGHTDLLAHLCASSRVAMMFHAPELKVVLMTVHVPLRDVPALLTRKVADQTIDLTNEALPQFGIARPRLAVA